jgi:hypothetical protein
MPERSILSVNHKSWGKGPERTIIHTPCPESGWCACSVGCPGRIVAGTHVSDYTGGMGIAVDERVFMGALPWLQGGHRVVAKARFDVTLCHTLVTSRPRVCGCSLLYFCFPLFSLCHHERRRSLPAPALCCPFRCLLAICTPKTGLRKEISASLLFFRVF